MKSNDSVVSPRLRYTVQEAASLLAISERQCWRLIANGRLRALKDGDASQRRRSFISHADLDRYVGNDAAAAG